MGVAENEAVRKPKDGPTRTGALDSIRALFGYPEEGIERLQDAVFAAEVAQFKVLVDLIEYASRTAKVRSIQSKYAGFIYTAGELELALG